MTFTTNISVVDEPAAGMAPDLGPAAQGSGGADEEIDDTADEAAVPNLLVEESELDQMIAEANRARPVDFERVPLDSAPLPANQVPIPTIRRTPLDEFNRSQALLSPACPTIYPRGAADFVEPRQREINYQDYITHAMKWHNGRFAKHHSFRFIALNTLMRQQAHGQGRYYVKNSRAQIFTKDQLQTALGDPDTPEAQVLLNSISRCAAALRGTRPFWYRRRKELEAFTPCLGCPSVFITLSPADLHWESLYWHMPALEYAEWSGSACRYRAAYCERTRTSQRGISSHATRHSRISFLRRNLTWRITGIATSGRGVGAATLTVSIG